MTLKRNYRTMAPASIERINNAFVAIEDELDFLVALDRAQLRGLAKLGLRNETFTRLAMNGAAQNRHVVPDIVGLSDLQADLELRDQLIPLQQRAQRLHERLHDSQVLLGAGLFNGALSIYKVLKALGHAAGLGSLVDDLGRRFKRLRRKDVLAQSGASTAVSAIQNGAEAMKGA